MSLVKGAFYYLVHVAAKYDPLAGINATSGDPPRVVSGIRQVAPPALYLLQHCLPRMFASRVDFIAILSPAGLLGQPSTNLKLHTQSFYLGRLRQRRLSTTPFDLDALSEASSFC